MRRRRRKEGVSRLVSGRGEGRGKRAKERKEWVEGGDEVRWEAGRAERWEEVLVGEGWLSSTIKGFEIAIKIVYLVEKG